MSYEVISLKQVVARKQYFCVWCYENILKGEKHLSRAYKMEGDFCADRMHLECDKALQSMPHDETCDGFTEGEFQRGSTLQKGAIGKNFIEDSLCE